MPRPAQRTQRGARNQELLTSSLSIHLSPCAQLPAPRSLRCTARDRSRVLVEGEAFSPSTVPQSVLVHLLGSSIWVLEEEMLTTVRVQPLKIGFPVLPWAGRLPTGPLPRPSGLPPWSSQTPALCGCVQHSASFPWGLVTGMLRVTHLALLPVTVWGNFAHCPRCPKHGLSQTLWAFSGLWVNSGAFDQSVSNNTPCLSSLDKGILYEFGCLI